MNNKVKTLIVRCLIVLFIGCLCTTVSNARVWGNWRECLITPCTGDSLTSSLNINLIESAGFFLDSHSSYNAFLNRVEMAEINGTDYLEFRETLYRAIENMEKAKLSYFRFKIAAEKIPNNPFMIDKLLKFDYEGFRVKNGLIAPIFEKVKYLLSKADISGIDTSILSNMDIILKQLYELKFLVDKEQSFESSLLWRITQDYSETILFGQYVSAVFKANL